MGTSEAYRARSQTRSGSRRHSLGAAVALAVIATASHAQDNPIKDSHIEVCKGIVNAHERLRCFDSATGAPEKPVIDPVLVGWEFHETNSPIDDSKQIFAVQLAEGSSETGLVFRCHERKVEVAFRPGKYLGTSSDGVRGLYRINSNAPVEMRLTGSTDGRAAFMRNPRDFMLALPDDGKLFIRAIGYNQAPHDAAFSLGKVSEVRARVLALCPAPAPSKRPPAKKE